MRDATVTGLADGGFIVTWQEFTTSGGSSADRYEIMAQVYTASGTPVGAKVHVNTTTTNIQSIPAVTALADGNLAITWNDLSKQGGDNSSSSIKGQIITTAGVKVGTEFLVNTQTANAQSRSTITGLKDGGFVVAWDDTSLQGGDASTSAIKAQLFRRVMGSHGCTLESLTTETQGRRNSLRLKSSIRSHLLRRTIFGSL